MAPKPEPEVESTGPNQWEVAAAATPGEQDWCVSSPATALPCWRLLTHPAPSLPRCRTYHARKNANEGKGDIVFNQLAYVPTCTHMPVCSPTCEAPIFMWKKKAAH